MRIAMALMLALSILHTRAAIGQAQVAGEIAEDTTWEGDVLTTDDVTVAEGVTLTIHPGAQVAFAGDAGLTVRGAIIAQATNQKPITFCPRSILAW